MMADKEVNPPNDPMSSIFMRKRRLLVGALVVPWVMLAIVSLDWLPGGWRWEHWPPALRTGAIVGFIIYFVVEVLFEVWAWGVTGQGDDGRVQHGRARPRRPVDGDRM